METNMTKLATETHHTVHIRSRRMLRPSHHTHTHTSKGAQRIVCAIFIA